MDRPLRQLTIALFVFGAACAWAASIERAPTNAAFAEHLAHLTKTVPEGFTVVMQPPFVVLGDESPEAVRRRATQTVSEYYAQARYLCYYLQEKGLFVKFYHQFAANAKTDPTGYSSLKLILGESDMEAFQRKWEKFVLGLRTQ